MVKFIGGGQPGRVTLQGDLGQYAGNCTVMLVLLSHSDNYDDDDALKLRNMLPDKFVMFVGKQSVDR